MTHFFSPIPETLKELFGVRNRVDFFLNSLFQDFLKYDLWTLASESPGELKASGVGIGPMIHTSLQALQSLRTMV